MTQTIKLFAYLKDQLGEELTLSLPPVLDRESVVTAVAEAFPFYAQEILSCNVAIDQQFIYERSVDNNQQLEIALIPPVSGG